MQYYECKKVENCFAGTNVYEYRLLVKLDEEFIEEFRLTGEVRCYRSFPRPFFQVAFSGGTTVKGIINDNIIKVVFPNMLIETRQEFEMLLTEMIRKKYCQ